MRFANIKLLSLLLVIVMFFGLSQWVVGQMTLGTPVVTAKEIRALQNNQGLKNSFVIVDVRSKAETDISIIPGALTQEEFEKTADQHQGKSIIAYCTIGVRSGNYADKLNQNGWKAWNYKGSILDWCKNSLPLTSDGRETNRVHTYSQWYSVPGNYVAVY